MPKPARICGSCAGWPKLSGEVAGAARLDAEPPADAAAEQEVADERLAADEDLVRQDVRRADLEAPGLEQRAQPALVLRPHLDVVLEHDRLPVERERGEGRVALERVEDAVDDRAEPQPERLERQVPLAVPVRVRDDEVTKVRHLGHRARSLLTSADTIDACASRPSSSTSTAPSSTPAAIILASMRHATREVLGREYSDEELLQTVGGPGPRGADARRSRPTTSNELVDVYRAHNEPLHDELEACAGMEDVLVRLHEEGRRLGVVTAKRRATVELAFANVPLGHLFETIVGGDETERHKPDPEPLLLGAERLGADPAATAYVGDSPFDVRAAKAAGMFAVAVTWGRIHDRARLEAEQPDAIVDTAEELLGVL